MCSVSECWILMLEDRKVPSQKVKEEIVDFIVFLRRRSICRHWLNIWISPLQNLFYRFFFYVLIRVCVHKEIEYCSVLKWMRATRNIVLLFKLQCAQCGFREFRMRLRAGICNIRWYELSRELSRWGVLLMLADPNEGYIIQLEKVSPWMARVCFA